MKYYSEEETGDIRRAFEKEVLSWPDISTKKMFGCPCYQREGKLFVFLVTGGLVLTKLDEDSKQKLKKKFEVEPFSTGQRTVSAWVRIGLKNKADIKKVMPFVKLSYDLALKN